MIRTLLLLLLVPVACAGQPVAVISYTPGGAAAGPGRTTTTTVVTTVSYEPGTPVATAIPAGVPVPAVPVPVAVLRRPVVAGVTAAATFPVRAAARGVARLVHNRSHACPTCGRTATVITGRGPVPGSHTHTCPFDGTTWWHN